MAVQKEQVFPGGVRLFNPHPSAPDFVKGTMVITINELVKFCKENEQYLTDYNGQKQLRLQQLQSSNGNLYAVVDTYRKEDAKPATKPATATGKQPAPDAVDDLPF